MKKFIKTVKWLWSEEPGKVRAVWIVLAIIILLFDFCH